MHTQRQTQRESNVLNSTIPFLKKKVKLCTMKLKTAIILKSMKSCMLRKILQRNNRLPWGRGTVFLSGMSCQ